MDLSGFESDADSLYELDELAPPQGPTKPFGTVLVGAVAVELDTALDLANEEPDGDDSGSSDGSYLDAVSASSSSTYPESESTLDPVSIDGQSFPPKDAAAKLKPPADMSAVSLAKSTTSSPAGSPLAAVAALPASPLVALSLDPASPAHKDSPPHADPAAESSGVDDDSPLPVAVVDPLPAHFADIDLTDLAPAPAPAAEVDAAAREVDLAAVSSSTEKGPRATEDFAAAISSAAGKPVETTLETVLSGSDTGAADLLSDSDTEDLTSLHAGGRPRKGHPALAEPEREASAAASDATSAKSESTCPLDSDDESFGVDARVMETPAESSEIAAAKGKVKKVKLDALPRPPRKNSSSKSNDSATSKDSAKSADSNASKGSTKSATSTSGAAPPKKSGGGFFFRASSTFYKAFKGKPAKSKRTAGSEPSRSPSRDVPPPPPPEPTPEELAQREEDEKLAHVKLEHHLQAQIATLRSAQSGFVDLALLKPMTESTLAAINGEARRILIGTLEVERRREHAATKTTAVAETAELELKCKEQLLVEAKLRLAEAQGEVESLKHELFLTQKGINQPERIAARERYAVRVRREKAERELNAAMESCDTMQKNLIDRQASLRREKAEVRKLEKSYQDLEGDWA